MVAFFCTLSVHYFSKQQERSEMVAFFCAFFYLPSLFFLMPSISDDIVGRYFTIRDKNAIRKKNEKK